jgi:hypothetical protein
LKKKKLKHLWVKRFEVMPNDTGDNWTLCRRCGVILRADGKNKNKACPGVIQIGLRDEDAD